MRKKYKMEAIVAFSVKDLEKGTIQYEIKSWKQKIKKEKK